MARPRKYDYLWVVQGHYAYGWEDVSASENWKEARDDLRAYRENEPGTAFRVIRRREPAPQPGAAETSEGPSEAEFEAALGRFLEAAQAMLDEHLERNYPRTAELQRQELAVDRGPRYVRIVREDVHKADDTVVSRSAWAFVDRATGDILKPAGWGRPAKHARGSIYAPNPLAGVGPYGPAYIRR